MNRIALALFASLSIGSAASAATLRVPQDFATIQLAVNAAVGGDRIKVANGTYVENVFIPAGKDGLVLEGSGKTIIDARPLGGPGSGAAVAGLSDGIVVRRLTVRHGKGAPAIGVYITADLARIERVTAIHCDDYGINVVGDGAVIDRCVVRSSSIGISVVGNDATIRKSSAQFVGNAGLFVLGNGNRVESTTVTTGDNDGIFVNGLDPLVTKCKVSGVRNIGISVFGGGAPTITNNTVRQVREMPALMVFGATAGLVQGNRIADVAHAGMSFTGGASNVVIRKNRIERTGVEAFDAGIIVTGNACSIADNLVRDAGNDGIRCLGNLHVLTKNRVLGSACDGIDVDAGLVTLIGNVALGNGGDGIENQGPGADMIGNRAFGNRRDISNGGVVTTFENNKFLNGGIGAPAVIDL
jgi:parallel beta-helix repeat protein